MTEICKCTHPRTSHQTHSSVGRLECSAKPCNCPHYTEDVSKLEPADATTKLERRLAQIEFRLQGIEEALRKKR